MQLGLEGREKEKKEQRENAQMIFIIFLFDEPGKGNIKRMQDSGGL